MFIQGQVYRRADLHAQYGGQPQGGISTPTQWNLIFLFSAASGKQFGYEDGWSDAGAYLYTGEGQVGDMVFTHGNAAIRNHLDHHKDLHLFEKVEQGRWRYVGQMILTGYQLQQLPDRNGQLRQVIVFELTPAGAFNNDDEVPIAESATSETLEHLSLAELRSRALHNAVPARDPRERRSAYRLRSRAIRLYALRRAQGICEGCAQPAPFLTVFAEPYLEVHHVYRLSDGGPDHPSAVVAICPTCHRKAHYSAEHVAFNRHLIEAAKHLEEDIE